MSSFAILVTVILFGLLFAQMTCIRFVKSLRNGNSDLKINQVVILCFFLGGPALLFSYIFPEVRIEDSLNKRKWLIFGIISTILEILIITLLFVFKVITF